MTALESAKNKPSHTQAYVNAREALCNKFLTDQHSPRLLQGLTDAMDKLILHISGELDMQGITIIATGGYGRRELFPYSDVDLLFLSNLENAALQPKIEAILYPLWDLNITIGHAVHDLNSALDAEGHDLNFKTALIDMRYIAGDRHAFEALQHGLRELKNSDTEQQFIEAKLQERDRRHKRFGDSRYMLEPNIKESKGGLRDLHTLEWLMKYAYNTNHIRDLVAEQMLSADEAQIFEKARKFLWVMRAHMHIIAGKAEERLTFDMQQKLALNMGFSDAEAHHAVERLMKRYFTNARIIGSLTRILCAILEESRKRQPKISLAKMIAAHWKLEGFVLDGGRLSVKSEDEFEKYPIRMLELFLIAAEQKLDIHPRALQWLTRHLDKIDRDFQHSYNACHVFMRILIECPEPETTLRRMNDVGLLGRFIPAFRRIVGQTQFNMYHSYTVDEHTIVALGILRQLDAGKHKEALPKITHALTQISKRHVLYLALLCHDIAKGRSGDHSELGEDIGRKLALRFGFSADDAELVAWLVRYHLLMSSTAFKRDLNDVKTIQDFVAMVKTVSRLRLLWVLTAADIRAVGPGVWNNWKGGLLEELYQKAETYIRTGQTQDTRDSREALSAYLQATSTAGDLAVQEYVSMSDSAYISALSQPMHTTIFGLMQRLGQGALFTTHMVHDMEADVSEITICTQDRSGLFASLSAALSLANANIISAKIYTRKDGIAVDIFQIQGLDGKAFDAEEKINRLHARLQEVLNGEINIAQALEKIQAPFPSKRKAALKKAPEIQIENAASNVFTVIEITSNDRVGLLHDIAKNISALNLSIASAHISTYGEQAVDVFYVKDAFGHKISHPARMREVEQHMLNALQKGAHVQT